MPTSERTLFAAMLAVALCGCPIEKFDKCKDNPAREGCSKADAAPDANDACGGCDEGTLCNPESKRCVQCLDNDDCKSVAGKPVCNHDANACVQCTPDDAAACEDNPCNPRTFTCSNFAAATQLPCDPCDTDANCKESMNRCVPMTYQGEPREGGYCLKSSKDRECPQPLSIETSDTRESLSGTAADKYCGINEMLATCQAVRALMENAPCGDDTDCPQPAGVCRKVGTIPGKACTYECNAASECIKSPTSGSTCAGGPDEDPSYCGG